MPAEPTRSQPGVGDDAAPPSTYNFHDVFFLQVAHRSFDAFMREQLGVFLDEIEEVDLRVDEGEVPYPDRLLSVDYSFDDSSFVVETREGRVRLARGRVQAAPSLGSSELLRWVRHAMRRQVIRRGVSYQHAAAVARDGIGYLFTAWGHTGKTNLALNFLANGYDYVADDWCFIARSGDILGAPAHLNLRTFNFECHPFLLTALGNRWNGRNLKRQLAGARFAHSLNPSRRLPRLLRRWLSDRSYVRVTIPVSRIFPDCRTTLRAPLSKVCQLTAARSGVGISEVSPEELARRVASFSHFERSRFRKARLAMAYTGHHDPPRDLLAAETELLTKAFEDATCLAVTVPPISGAEDVAKLRQLLEQA